MKIISIRINNITSFVNEHFINFNELIGDDSLFAITGPTGSGKSSIITAISLALYGKGHKKSLNSSDYISQGTASGSIRLNFQINGKEYTATWRCKVRKKDGTLIKTPVPKRELFLGNVAVESTTEQILGLSYDHFCKTTILNQGEFAKFITSSFKDRKDILESMHDNIYLSSISTALNKQIKALREKIKYLTDLEKNSHPYSAEEKIIINKRVENSQKKISAVTPLFDIVNSINHIIDNITKVQEQFINNEKKINLLTNEVSTIREEFNKSSNDLNRKTHEFTLFHSTFIKNNKLLNKAIKDHEIVNLKSEKLNEHKKYLEITYQDIMHNENLAEKAKIELKNANRELNNNFSKLTINKDKIHDLQLINEQINSIDTLSSNVSIHSKSIKEIEIEMSRNLSEIEKNKALILRMNSDYDQILKKYNVFFSIDNFDKVINDLDVLKQSTQDRERKIRDVKINLDRSENELTSLENQKNVLSKKQIKVTNSLDNIQKEISDLTSNKNNLLLRQNEQKRNHSIATLSSEGLIKQECPVCLQKWPDNITHSKYQHIDNDIDNEIEELYNVLKTRENKALIINQDVKQLSNQINTISSSIIKLNEDKEKSLVELNTNHSSPLKEDKLEDEINLCSDKYLQINSSQNKLISVYEKIKAIKEANDKLTSTIIINQSKLNNLNKESSDNQTKIKEQINLISKIAPEYGNDKKNIITYYRNDTITKSNIIKNENKIQKAELELGYLLKKAKELTSHSKKNEEQIPLLQKEIELLKEEIKQISPNLSPLDDLNKLQQDRESETNQLSELKQLYFHLKAQQDICENNLSIAKTQKEDMQLLLSLEFNKIKQLNIQNLDDCKHISFPQDEQKILNDTINSIKEFSSINISNISFEQLKIIKILNNNLITTSTSIIKKLLLNENNALTENTTKMEIISQKEKELQSLRAEVQDQNRNLIRLETLDNILGKNEFRNFALSLIEQRLIDQANIELKSLCDDRYTIKQKHGTHGPEYFIDDKWNIDGVRKISTLSGGETFLIGLSMALSLAEFSRGYTQLDFFFIDEGFGTLDDQSLDEVLNVLLSLNSRGKQIGIISHVTKLTDQIPINLALSKNGLGESIINNYYN